LNLYFWINPSLLPSSYALPIGLIGVDRAGKYDGTDSATGGLTIKDLQITARMEYRQLKLPQTECGSEKGLRPCRGFPMAPYHGDSYACMPNDTGHVEGDHYTTAKSYGQYLVQKL